MNKLLYYRNKFDVSRSSGFDQNSNLEFLSTEDGEQVAMSYLPYAGTAANVGYLVVHGLLAHHRAPGVKEFVQSLTRHGHVWAIDLRGHGLSSGRCTLGNREAIDIAAAIRSIRNKTNVPIVGIGFSMGAAALVRCAALFEKADAVVAVSGPAEWHGERRWAAYRTSLIWHLPFASTALRIFTGVRIDTNWVDSEAPAEVIGKIGPSPVLVVHGTDDDFFPESAAEDLWQAAADPRGIWLIDQGRHAEGLFSTPGAPVIQEKVDDFVDSLLDRLNEIA